MSTQPISSSPISTAVSSHKRTRGDDPGEEEKKTAERSPSLDVEGICNAILFGSDIDIPALNVDVLITQYPDILPLISQHSKKDLMQIFNICTSQYQLDQQSKIKRTILVLYSESLRNSSTNEMIKDLEKNVSSYLNLSQKKRFHELIYEASCALAEKKQEPQVQIRTLAELTMKINQLLMLFSYIDFENQERIENLYTYTRNHGGITLFPNCKRDFPTLCQYLNTCQNERVELSKLQKELLLKSTQLREQVKSFYIASNPPLFFPEREHFYKIYAIPFWETGAQLLESAFRATFQEKRERKIYLPDAFVAAVRKISRKDPFKSLTFNALLYGTSQELPQQFVHEIWLEFLGEENPTADIGDFMRYVLNKLPEAAFQKLMADLKTAADRKQMIFNTTIIHLRKQIRGRMTLMSLKTWLNSTRDLSE